MTGTCTVFGTGEQVTDPQTGEVTTSPAVVWSGPCYVRPNDAQARSSDIGGAETFVYDYLFGLPFDATGVIEGHRVTVTDYPEDAELVGITVEVQKVARGSVTARRLLCQEVS